MAGAPLRARPRPSLTCGPRGLADFFPIRSPGGSFEELSAQTMGLRAEPVEAPEVVLDRRMTVPVSADGFATVPVGRKFRTL
jgi:hypothetical protein